MAVRRRLKVYAAYMGADGEMAMYFVAGGDERWVAAWSRATGTLIALLYSVAAPSFLGRRRALATSAQKGRCVLRKQPLAPRSSTSFHAHLPRSVPPPASELWRAHTGLDDGGRPLVAVGGRGGQVGRLRRALRRQAVLARHAAPCADI